MTLSMYLAMPTKLLLKPYLVQLDLKTLRMGFLKIDIIIHKHYLRTNLCLSLRLIMRLILEIRRTIMLEP